jgi:phenylpyruvate tautomerase PptA (4-oxalocrotonate tautomerase family)
MPNILVTIPKGGFPGNARAALVRSINDAATEAEQMPADPNKQFLCWVIVDEADQGAWTCGGADLSEHVLPCIAMVYVPAGVLDAASRERYAQLMHEAFRQSMPAEDRRQLATSVVLHEVADGTWAANGAIWTLPDFTRASGYAHLQHLIAAA